MKALVAMVAAASLAGSAARPAQSRPSGKSRARQVFVTLDVGVARGGVRLRISHRRGQQ